MNQLKNYLVEEDLEYSKFNSLCNFNSRAKNFYIYGPPGVGKTTFLINCIKKLNFEKVKINDIFEIPKYKVQMFNVNNWINDKVKSWNNDKENQFLESTKINTKADVLLIDDLGSEFFHTSTVTYILNLFEERYEYVNKYTNKTITIITSNYSFEELREKYIKLIKDETTINRLFSRIEGVIENQIKFIGNDKRKNKTK